MIVSKEIIRLRYNSLTGLTRLAPSRTVGTVPAGHRVTVQNNLMNTTWRTVTREVNASKFDLSELVLRTVAKIDTACGSVVGALSPL